MAKKYKNYKAEDYGKILVYRDEMKLSFREIAKRMNCHHSQISRMYKKIKSGSIKRKLGSGPPRKYNNKLKKKIVRLSEKNRRKTAVDIAKEVRVSATSIKRFLNDAGLFGRIAAKKPLLTSKQIKNRLHFAKKYITKTKEWWHKVVFVDEARFAFHESDGIVYVRRRKGERYRKDCVTSTLKFGGGGIMAFGALNMQYELPLYNIVGTLNKEGYNKILNEWILPIFTDHPELILLQDNDPKHSAKINKDFLVANGISSLKFPSNSPDLNPIEHVWYEIKKELRKMTISTKNKEELFKKVDELWKNVSDNFIKEIIDSMPRRLEAVIKNKGFHTKY